ncbi:MAG: FmdE family protein [Thermodesulfovibrionales bacterium]|nr:FmdE family protein [Thermodesulfovibrionales bacterium]
MKSYDDVVKFHGHSCPGLALGYRVGLRALKELGLEQGSSDEEIVAIVENDSCAVDAIQVITGCTFGKGNLIFNDYGKQVYTIVKRPSGEGVRISIDYIPPEESAEEREAWRRYSEGDRSEDVLKIVHSRKAKKLAAILDATDEEIMKLTKVKIELPKEAKIYRSVRCEVCGEKVAEPKARLKEGRILCIPCFQL